MKKNRKWWLAKVSMMLAWLTAQLGLTSCDNAFSGGAECMYGTPSADYSLSLKIKDEAGKPLAGQKVVVRPTNINGEVSRMYTDYINHYGADTIVTNTEGKYEGVAKGWFPGAKGVRFVVEKPVDPSLKPDSVNVALKQTKKGDGSWYEGTFEGKAEMTLKKSEETAK